VLEFISSFLASTGISEAAFGAMAINDVRLVDKLRRGKPLTDDAANRVMLFIENYDEAHK
jgi:hypothetical protein